MELTVSLNFGADYGAVSAFASRLKDISHASQRGDVFFVNNGDHVEGSGLSDATLYTTGIHGSSLFPIISQMPFDVLTVGNHDLYDDETIDFMIDSGFIDGWNKRYLTSNTFKNDNNELTRVGAPYVVMEGDVTKNKYVRMERNRGAKQQVLSLPRRFAPVTTSRSEATSIIMPHRFAPRWSLSDKC